MRVSAGRKALKARLTGSDTIATLCSSGGEGVYIEMLD